MEFLLDPNIWISLLTLTVLEIVLGIDNIIFISILAGKLPKHEQAKARRWGLILALGTRLLLLASLAYIVRLTAPWFTVLGAAISGRDLVLLAGGLFLIYKSTREIHERLEENSSVGGEITRAVGKGRGFGSVLVQIMLLDIVFSLDSVITAVGMASHLWIMVTAVIAAMLVMLVAVNAISRFVEAHPTVKMLALSFLLLVGTALIAEG
ncbi:MAG: TerC family protein, partial [Fibrobacteria bacterium]|nr:TerC family protein [Fibrobacteria bacterium]